MKAFPLVSVLVPVWNRERTIARALDSILASDYPNFEVIVADNASTDRTLAILADYETRFSNLQVIRNDSNIGPVPNWRRCFEASRGELIKYVWSDDAISQNSLTVLAGPLIDDHDVGVTICPARLLTEEGAFMKELYGQPHGRRLLRESLISGFALKVPHLPYSPGCALIRRNFVDLAFARIGTLDPECVRRGIGPDVILMYEAFLHGSAIVGVMGTTVAFYSGGSSITHETRSEILKRCYDKSVLHLLGCGSTAAKTYRLLRYIRSILDRNGDRSGVSPEIVGQFSELCGPNVLVAASSTAFRSASELSAFALRRLAAAPSRWSDSSQRPSS